MTSEFPVFGPNDYFTFPPATAASSEGVVCWGGNLTPGMLISAYRQGIFPWYSHDQPVLWWSPDPRFILRPANFHISRSFRKFLAKQPYRVTLDSAFQQVIRACASVPRPEQDGTWITDDIYDSYCVLHKLGVAHSVEVWDGSGLAGGLYGVAVGSIFAGESMFCYADNASKTALAVLSHELALRGAPLIDCQIFTEHMAASGGESMSRNAFLSELKTALLSDSTSEIWAGPDEFGSSFYQSVSCIIDHPV